MATTSISDKPSAEHTLASIFATSHNVYSFADAYNGEYGDEEQAIAVKFWMTITSRVDEILSNNDEYIRAHMSAPLLPPVPPPLMT